MVINTAGIYKTSFRRFKCLTRNRQFVKILSGRCNNFLAIQGIAPVWNFWIVGRVAGMMGSSGGAGPEFPRECPLAKLGRSSPPYQLSPPSAHSSSNTYNDHMPHKLSHSVSSGSYNDVYSGASMQTDIIPLQTYSSSSSDKVISTCVYQYHNSCFESECNDVSDNYQHSLNAMLRNCSFDRYHTSSNQSSDRRYRSHSDHYQHLTDVKCNDMQTHNSSSSCEYPAPPPSLEAVYSSKHEYRHRNITPSPSDAAKYNYSLYLSSGIPKPSATCNYIVDQIDKLGRGSPSFDQGYHTLVSPSPGPSTPRPWIDCSTKVLFKGKARIATRNNCFSVLPDSIILKIFSSLSSSELCACGQVCRRFEQLVWTPSMWKIINLKSVSGDKAIRNILTKLCGHDTNVQCPTIERVFICDGARLTDKGLVSLARRCPELTHLQVQGCAALTNIALFELVARCHNLQHLDITGCTRLSTLSGPNISRKLLLQYLDLTDCSSVDDNGLRLIVASCPQLIYLYLRRCVQITDAGIKCVPSFCSALRELSVSDCANLTDFGLYELAKLGATLRYLSVAKCDRVSDPGLKVIVRRCYKLRYLNARGCEAVSDDAITVLARSCPRLRALDIGKCDVTDNGLRQLAESCPNLKKLSLRNCELITDKGVQCIAYYCRGLQLLNIQDCQITIEGYRAVKQFCKRCVIEHTNPGFF